ncbi:4Fe-4S dicluster domain-containing protein [Candidatus Bipolaricaulota bacterium]
MKYLVADPSKCRGCQTCELACPLAHGDGPRPRAARIRVFQDLGVCQPRVCVQCEKPKCIEACNVGAIYLDSVTNGYRVDEARCVSCGQCIEACPFEGVWLHPVTSKAIMCDQCGACVEACPFDALSLSQRSSEVLEVRS